MLKKHYLPSVTIALAASIPASAAVTWLTSPEEALAQAEKQQKSVMIDFTGSDWCGFCIRLEKTVFASPEFEKVLGDKYVFLMLDYPRSKKLSEKQKKVNDDWKKKMAITGFPTIVLMDSKGLPYAKHAGAILQVDGFLKAVDRWEKSKVQRDQLFEKAKKQQGPDKAKSLYEGLKTMDESLWQQFFPDVIDSIKKADPEDKCQFQTYIAQKERIETQKKEMTDIFIKYRSDPEKRNLALDDMLKRGDLENTVRQQIMLTQTFWKLRSNQKANPEKAESEYLKDLEAIIAIDPNSKEGKNAQQLKEQYQKQKVNPPKNGIPATKLVIPK